MKVGIIGAGPAGLTCAVKLAEQGVDVSIYESDKTVGGMTKSFDLWGQKVDLGPHRFFSMDQRINDFWLSYVGEDYIMEGDSVVATNGVTHEALLEAVIGDR